MKVDEYSMHVAYRPAKFNIDIQFKNESGVITLCFVGPQVSDKFLKELNSNKLPEDVVLQITECIGEKIKCVVMFDHYSQDTGERLPVPKEIKLRLQSLSFTRGGISK